MTKKINSEYKINDNNSFIITMGTSNKKVPEIIYSVLSTYITPNCDDYDESIFDELSKIIKKMLTPMIRQYGLCEKDIIVVTDVATSRISYYKPSYFDTEIYFKIKKDIISSKEKKFKDISEEIYNTYIKTIASKIEEIMVQNGFDLSKSKNKAEAVAIY